MWHKLRMHIAGHKYTSVLSHVIVVRIRKQSWILSHSRFFVISTVIILPSLTPKLGLAKTMALYKWILNRPPWSLFYTNDIFWKTFPLTLFSVQLLAMASFSLWKDLTNIVSQIISLAFSTQRFLLSKKLFYIFRTFLVHDHKHCKNRKCRLLKNDANKIN